MVNTKCSFCGKGFLAHQSEIARGGGKYCSRACFNNGHVPHNKGISLKSTIIECRFCGTEFKSYKSAKRIFCSTKCTIEYNKAIGFWAKENNPSWKGGFVIKKCKYCQNEFKVKYGSRDQICFCSKQCRAKWQSENKHGSNHPNWKGGYKGKRERMSKDIKYILHARINSSIHAHLKKGVKNKQKWTVILGYTTEQLAIRLNSTMPEGYTWDSFIRGDLHIDHIVPVKVFNFTDIEHIDFKRCWALDNLRLLPAKENRIKSTKLLYDFQPSLAL